jgi:hypothetical protein
VTEPLRLECRSMSLPIITELTRNHFVLFGMQNRTFGPYSAAIHRTLISALQCTQCTKGSGDGTIAETNKPTFGPTWHAEYGTFRPLFGNHGQGSYLALIIGHLGPFSATIHRSLLSLMYCLTPPPHADTEGSFMVERVVEMVDACISHLHKVARIAQADAKRSAVRASTSEACFSLRRGALGIMDRPS